MTTSTTASTATDRLTAPGASLLPRIGRGLEGLWLLAVLLVPLVFLGKDYAISEAEIGNVEVPKVALLRTLAAVIAVLWSLEWAIKGWAIDGDSISVAMNSIVTNARPSKSIPAFRGWLKVHPMRWFLLAAGLFFGCTFVSTVLSGSFTTSLWGEIPGQDGYSAYTIASYGVLFGVIATHIKTRSQISRLLGAVVLMGILVGLYASLQHYGHDFLNSVEASGGGNARVTVFMGNALFAAAVLAMTIPVTLVAAAINLHDENWGDWKPLSRFGQLGRDWMATALWAMILSVQLLGLVFTFSRGSWGGTVLALVVFLGVIALGFGWRMVVQIGLVLGLAAVLLIAFLHWQGSISILNVGAWLGFLLALLGAASTFTVLFVIKRFRWAFVLIAVGGVAVIITGASIIGPSALSGRGVDGPVEAGARSDSTTDQVVVTITSIQTEVLGGLIGGRSTHWKASWELIKNRPWFAFDDLSLSWLRPLIGYGPDLFRYTYLLESPPEGGQILPLEPDHAHNYFIHQTVEQGYLGGLVSIALFVSVFGVAGHQLLRSRLTGDPICRLLIFGLAAVIIGRFLEMMVGVSRVSDLTVLWAIFGLFAASVAVDNANQDAAVPSVSEPAQIPNRRSRRRAARASAKPSFSTGLIIRLAVVAWIVGGLGVVTWQKSINYVRASVAEGRALQHFREGDFDKSIKELDRAIELAPGIPIYYYNRANIFSHYQLRPEDLHEPVCGQQEEVPYLVCLGVQSLESNLESVNQQPFYYRASIAAGNAAFKLNLYESAIESYSRAANLVPNAWPIRNDLAESHFNAGLYEAALTEANASLKITGDSDLSTVAMFFKGRALRELGRLEEAKESFKQGLSLNYVSSVGSASLEQILDINTELGLKFDLEYFDQSISQDPKDAVAYYFRGLAHLALGNTERASLDLSKSHSLGLYQADSRAAKGYALFKAGGIVDAEVDLTLALKAYPESALVNAYLAELNMYQGNFYSALDRLEMAKALDPNLGLVDLVLGKFFMSLGLEESAKSVFNSSSGLDLPTAQHYADRGEIHAFFGDHDLAFSDLDEAIRIDPTEAKHYNARAKTHANRNSFESALADFNVAIQLAPDVAEFFINRGVVNEILGENKPSLADFERARSLGEVEPPPDSRDASYFTVFTDTTSVETENRQLLNLENERAWVRDLELYSGTSPGDTYQSDLKLLSEALINLEKWEAAIENLSRLIDISPTDSEAYRNRGETFLALNNPDAAISDYIEAVRLDPGNAENLVARAKGYIEIGNYGMARGDLDEAIRLDPNSSNAYAFRGYLSARTGNHLMAFPDINRAIEISPLNDDAYFKRATANIGLGQTSLALKDLGRALQLAPTNFEYLYSRALLRYELGELDSAIEDFSEAIALKVRRGNVDPRHALPFISRGMIYLEIGKPKSALDDLNRAVGRLYKHFSTDEWENYRPTRNGMLADAYRLLVDIHSELGDLDQAREAMARVGSFE